MARPYRIQGENLHGGMQFSAVSRAALDFKRQLEKDRGLRKLVKAITSKVEV